MARNAGAPPREERAEPSRAEIEQGCRQMFEVDKPISSSRPALSHVKAAPGFRILPIVRVDALSEAWVVSRARVHRAHR
jgi:hypothetical protein